MMKTTTATTIICADTVLAELQLTAVPDRLDEIELGDKVYRVQRRKLVLTEMLEGIKVVGHRQSYVLTVEWLGRVQVREGLNC